MAATLIVLGALAAVTATSGAQTPDELREQRRKAQQDAAEAAADVDAYTEDAEELSTALEALEADIDAQRAALDAARRAVEAADAAEVRAIQAVVELDRERETTVDSLTEAAIESFVEFQGGSDFEEFVDDPWDTIRSQTLAEFGTGSGTDDLDRLRTIDAELAEQRRLAEEAAAEARRIQAEIDARLAELGSAVARQQEILDDVEDRLDRRLYEAAMLAELDSELAGKIQAEEDRIARAAAAAAVRAAEAARAAAQPGSAAPTNTVRPGPAAAVELAKVNGITVNVAIAEQLRGLLAAMQAEGFKLYGWGYRTHQRQIELRRKHCGTSDFAVWEMSASACRPPTARPGQSNHEIGRAVDFYTYINGRARGIGRRDSAVFLALARIGPKFGFCNLPSEPWHWDNVPSVSCAGKA